MPAGAYLPAANTVITTTVERQTFLRSPHLFHSQIFVLRPLHPSMRGPFGPKIILGSRRRTQIKGLL